MAQNVRLKESKDYPEKRAFVGCDPDILLVNLFFGTLICPGRAHR
jgi:hypothetical protein